MKTDSAGDQSLLVDIEALTLRIADRNLIEQFTLRLKTGKRVGLTGRSGCGKTTLLRSIVGRRLNDDSGAARFEITNRRVGYVPQQGGVLPWFSLRRNLETFASRDEPDRDKWCAGILAGVELSHVGAAFPKDLSGGELQRARLACAVAARPALCCADEPLTEVGLRQKWRLLQRWSAEMSEVNTSLILVSHDVDTLIYLCDDVLVLGGPRGEVTRTVTQFEIPAGAHPRNPADISSGALESTRRYVVKTILETESGARIR